MKLSDVIILSLSVVFVIIGIHQTMTYGFGEGYWAVMLSICLLFVYFLRKKKPDEAMVQKRQKRSK